MLTGWLVLAVGCEQAPTAAAPESEVALPAPQPVLESIAPMQIPGNQASTLRLMGPSNADDGLFEIGDVVLVNGQPVDVAHFSPRELVVELSPLPKGTYWVAVERNGNSTEKRALEVLNSSPQIIAPDFLRVAENDVLEAAFVIRDFD